MPEAVLVETPLNTNADDAADTFSDKCHYYNPTRRLSS